MFQQFIIDKQSNFDRLELSLEEWHLLKNLKALRVISSLIYYVSLEKMDLMRHHNFNFQVSSMTDTILSTLNLFSQAWISFVLHQVVKNAFCLISIPISFLNLFVEPALYYTNNCNASFKNLFLSLVTLPLYSSPPSLTSRPNWLHNSTATWSTTSWTYRFLHHFLDPPLPRFLNLFYYFYRLYHFLTNSGFS